MATIDPYENLQPGTSYVVTLTDDIESATGVRLTNSGDWTFTTDTPAQVLTRYPSAGATDAPTSTNVSITFDKALDPSTVNASSFHLESATGNGISAGVTLSTDGRTAILNPALDLTGGMTYVARLENSVRTLTGVGVLDTPLTWSFSTILAPRITATVPASDAVNQPVNQPSRGLRSGHGPEHPDHGHVLRRQAGEVRRWRPPSPTTRHPHRDTYAPRELPGRARYQVTLSTAVKGAQRSVTLRRAGDLDLHRRRRRTHPNLAAP